MDNAPQPGGAPAWGGPFREGELVLLISRKGRRHLLQLDATKLFETHTGTLPHSGIIGQEVGSRLLVGGQKFLALRPTLAELERYCYCVACCVGLLAVEIFGYRSAAIPTFALHLSHAFQLTNILRDVAEDAERGRIYLPVELLAKHGLEQVTPEEIVKAPGVEKVCAEIGAIARGRFAEASRAMPSSERRNMRPALLMRGVYEPYLDRIEAAGFRVDGPRVKFSKFGKLSLVFSALLRTL